MTVALPARLDCAGLLALVDRPGARFVLAPQTVQRLESSRAGLERVLADGVPVYGSTTGFGPHVRYAADDDPVAQGAGLIAHLASGAGAWAEPELVRATMVVRANALAQGVSGIRPAALQALLDLLHAGLVPAVPELGSVGASGDLIPLAHVARVITGEGEVLAEGGTGPGTRTGTRPAAEALAGAGLAPVALDARDALALVNGTGWSTALAALAAARAGVLLERAADLTGWLYASLGARRQALDPRLHAVRGQRDQQQTAARIRAEADRHPRLPGFPAREHPERPLQEVYSVRCAPQVLGPAFRLVRTATEILDDELAGVSDNPVLVEDLDVTAGWVALHGGNFHAAAAGTAADLLTGALTQVAVLAERQVDVLADPATSRGPLLLASRPGAQAGLAGAQLTASALVAEIRHACQWASTMSVPTNARNQDVVPMAPLAARTALAQLDRVATVLAVLAVSLTQYQHLVGRGLADGLPADPPEWLPAGAGFDHDVETRSLIENARAHLLRMPAPAGVPAPRTGAGGSAPAALFDDLMDGESRVP